VVNKKEKRQQAYADVVRNSQVSGANVTPLGSSTSQNFHASRKSIFQRISLVHRPFGPRRLVFQRIG
jgi:hypothetical protein